MKLLLDTHIFLWYITGNSRLSNNFINLIRDPANEVYLSSVSMWEIIIKHQIGKLPLPQSPEVYIPLQRQRHLIESLALDEDSVTQLPSLPAYHRDPFDRILICQAIQNEMSLISTDKAVTEYHSYVSLIS